MFSRRTDWDLEPNPLTLAHREALARGKEIIDLTLSNPTRCGIEYDQAAILDALRSRETLAYSPEAKGMREARERVREYYDWQAGNQARSDGAKSLPGPDPDSLVLTTSTSEGYSHIFRLLLDPGDEVLVPQPSYPLLEFLAGFENVRLAPYSLTYDHGWQIDWHSLEAALNARSRAILALHPNNPTGSYVNRLEREKLNKLCAARGMALIVDEVFLDYAHDCLARTSFIANQEALTFTLSGLSKISGLPQMKLGWIGVSGPPQEAAQALMRLELIADTYLSLSAPIQLAAGALLDQRKKIQPQLIGRVKENLAELDHQLGEQTSSTRLLTEGGWCVVVRIPVTGSDEDFAIELLRRSSVLVHPGHFYDFPRDGFLVLSLICRKQDFRTGVRRLLALTNRA